MDSSLIPPHKPGYFGADSGLGKINILRFQDINFGFTNDQQDAVAVSLPVMSSISSINLVSKLFLVIENHLSSLCKL